jgi:hypothetical protein
LALVDVKLIYAEFMGVFMHTRNMERTLLKSSTLAAKVGGVLRYRFRQVDGFGLLPKVISNSLRTCNELERDEDGCGWSTGTLIHASPLHQDR